ncbi:helicase-related protein [Butyrivibrio sp. AE3009]|uniref:helicase-related protein n=1 Tax=Butyrivibrio sp. AE3009 TaxID=1280666 RepID=UPI0003B6EF67|nr:helicase-related protein [Butyrivibrio sp. AE3009]
MSIRDLDINVSYAGKGNVILQTFLLPVMKEALTYDRVTSFFTVESLLAVSQGIQDIYDKSGKMRLIIGIHSFPEELVEASVLQEYLEKQISEIREKIVIGIRTISDSLEKERLATIAWMIQDGLLEVKAASVRGRGLFHPKTMIFKDQEENAIAAIGSPNETRSGLGSNFEQILVVKSWENPEAIKTQEQFFESLWNNEDEDVYCYDISEDTADMIREGLGKEFVHLTDLKNNACDNIIKKSSKMLTNFFVSGDIPALYMHQERAVIDALSRWPVRVMFSDEVGLGKTFEVAATMVFLMKYCGIKKTYIFTPKSVLQQWQDELSEHFGINAWLYDSGNRMYIDVHGRTKSIGYGSPIGKNAPDVILMSAQYARGTKAKGSVFDSPDAILPDLLIVDEAHAARISKDLGGNSRKTRMYNVLESVSKQIPHLILATATPMQKDADEYHAMLKLLGLPSLWQKNRVYRTSLRLIASSEIADISDGYSAASFLMKTIDVMKPDCSRLSARENAALSGLVSMYHSTDDQCEIGTYVSNNWDELHKVFVKMHPAHLLTVRNTRRALEHVGYKFPKRNLTEVSIDDSMPIQLYYNKVNDYLTDSCFLVEKALYDEDEKSVGFVRVSYQQRVASSLYSCMKSLERRLEKINQVKAFLEIHEHANSLLYKEISFNDSLDDFDSDERLNSDADEIGKEKESGIDFKDLKRAIGIETTALTSLINEAEKLMKSCGDLKVIKSIELAREYLSKGEPVLLFSRYTDTIEALLTEFKRVENAAEIEYGIYTGKTSCIVKHGNKVDCDKNEIKRELFSGKLKLMFCSDAASEGLNLQAATVLINVDVPWTPARLEQRIGRIARLGQMADEVKVFNVWYPYSIEARMYHRIQKRLDQTNLAIGEFPEVMALNIRLAVIDDEDDEQSGVEELREIRNSSQIKALEQLWNRSDEKVTTSEYIRNSLLELCEKNFENIEQTYGGRIKTFKMPDGKTVSLTTEAGMKESISLKSSPWRYSDFSSNQVRDITDDENHEICFEMAGAEERRILKHEEVIHSLLGYELTLEDTLEGYPQMLPNPKRLDLSYAIENMCEESPDVWGMKVD